MNRFLTAALLAAANALPVLAAEMSDAEVRKVNQTFYEFMVPLIKGYSTEMSLEVTSLGVQVHGGMGFIEETGAAQYYRDAIRTLHRAGMVVEAGLIFGFDGDGPEVFESTLALLDELIATALVASRS